MVSSQVPHRQLQLRVPTSPSGAPSSVSSYVVPPSVVAIFSNKFVLTPNRTTRGARAPVAEFATLNMLICGELFPRAAPRSRSVETWLGTGQRHWVEVSYVALRRLP